MRDLDQSLAFAERWRLVVGQQTGPEANRRVVKDLLWGAELFDPFMEPLIYLVEESVSILQSESGSITGLAFAGQVRGLSSPSSSNYIFLDTLGR